MTNDFNEKEVLNILKEAGNRPVPMRELIKRLQVPIDIRRAFRTMVRQMNVDEKIFKVKGGRYLLPEHGNLVTGRIQGHHGGFAFLIPDNKEEPDIYINPRKLRDAFHGDRVVVRVEPLRMRDKREGVVIKVIERGHPVIIGTYHAKGKNAYVIPEERRIPHNISVPFKYSSSARSGQIVKVEITQYPTLKLPAEGKIVGILGYSDDPDIEIEIAVHKYGLPTEFPEPVLKEADKCLVEINQQEIEKRLDIRGLKTFTIDGETAKDFDDAVSIEKLKNGDLRLGVHIADVSYYVTEKSELDKEAYQRGTSVYFPDRAIPMLPEKLSNGICSLRPDEDRLSVSLFMNFDKKGEMAGYEIAESVMRSRERMTYTNVSKIFDGDKELLKRYKDIKDDLFMMKELVEVLRKKRMAHGSIDFDLPEADVILDMDGKIENIVEAERTEAHRLIEEFMLTANKTIASHLFCMEVPSLYRVHEKPELSKIEVFNEFAHNFGYHIKGAKNIHPKALQKILKEVRERPEERLINTLLLRSMKQARYSEENAGHFALAFHNYTHFTSPIRRYPDLMVHRILREAGKKGKFSKKRTKELEESLPVIAEHSSERERLAQEAERDIVDLKKAQFMMNKIGEEYCGYITGVTSFGFFVELENLFVEGLVHVSSLEDDYYIYLEDRYMLKGERKGKTYSLGDRVCIRVENVSIEKREIDFSLLKKTL
jgi:ribonuclease R